VTIPIENLYYLLCYAWDQLDEVSTVAVTLTPETRLADLFARVLSTAVTHQFKRGLDRSYTEISDDIAGIRGRLDISKSAKRATFARARAWCEFDELSVDVPHNQIVKATLRRLAATAGVDPDNVERMRELYRRMNEVREVTLTGQCFGNIRLGRNNKNYKFLLQVCEIVYRNLLVDEATGRATFRDFTKDDDQMARLFERFVRNFYAREQCQYTVSAPQLRWSVHGEAEDVSYVPIMRTDIVLRGMQSVVIIDTKYYATMLQGRFDRASIQSSHVYQLFAYLANFQRIAEGGGVAGMLLYPRTTETVRVRVQLNGFPFEACTINLAQPWQDVRRDLLELVRVAA
jgi:5-methylcytosine-specific restriction enzyme subunit McrC